MKFSILYKTLFLISLCALLSCEETESYDQPTVGFFSGQSLSENIIKGSDDQLILRLEFSKRVAESGTVTIGVDKALAILTNPELDPFSNTFTLNISPGTVDTFFVVNMRDFASEGLYVREYPHNFTIESVSGGVRSIGLKAFRLNVIDLNALNSLDDIRNLYAGGLVPLDENTRIRGVVTTDNSERSIFSANGYIQDEWGAVRIAYGSIPSGDPGGNLINNPFAEFNFQPGDTIEIVGGNGTALRRRFNREDMEIAVLPANVSLVSSGPAPEPKEITVEELNELVEIEGTNYRYPRYESRLVILKNVTFTDPGVSIGGTVRPFRDTDGNLGNLFVALGANFSGESVPEGSVDIIGIVSRFNDAPQLLIQRFEDIKKN